jgi:ATP-binding cassette subfamily F protein uup
VGGDGGGKRRAPDKPTPSPLRGSSPPAGGRGSKLSYKDQRDLDRLPGEIERIEAEIGKAERALADPDLYARDPGAFASRTLQLADLRAEKEAAEERWLEVAETAERLS